MKQSKKQNVTHQFHRARKAPKCPACGRTMKRRGKRHPMSQAKRRMVWTPDHYECQFQGGK